MEPQQTSQAARANGLAAMLGQLALRAHTVMDLLKPLIDQPVIRMPYTMSTRVPLTVPAGATGTPFVAGDFTHSLEYPFEIERVKPTQDPAHTSQDWRLGITDQTFSQLWFKTGTQQVDGLIDTNTGVWYLKFPWVVRPKGGALLLTADNLDLINPIVVEVEFSGFLLIPRA